jgi:hypothetical protein
MTHLDVGLVLHTLLETLRQGLVELLQHAHGELGWDVALGDKLVERVGEGRADAANVSSEGLRSRPGRA